MLLVLDGEGLLALNYNLVAFSDPVWGEGECDWENEVACWDRDIEHLDKVLIAVEPVPPERFELFLDRGRLPFKPAIPPTGHFELSGINGAIKRLTKGKIPAAAADTVMSALAALDWRCGSPGTGSRHRQRNSHLAPTPGATTCAR